MTTAFSGRRCTSSLLMEFGPKVGMPHSRAMRGGLFELRAHGGEGIGRAMYCSPTGQRIVLLHAFIKKTQSTHKRAQEKGRRRMKEAQMSDLKNTHVAYLQDECQQKARKRPGFSDPHDAFEGECRPSSRKTSWSRSEPILRESQK